MEGYCWRYETQDQHILKKTNMDKQPLRAESSDATQCDAMRRDAMRRDATRCDVARSGVLQVPRCESLASAANMPTAALANSSETHLSALFSPMKIMKFEIIHGFQAVLL